MFYLGGRSRERLQGVHPDLIIVLATAIQRTPIDFSVIEGLRTQKRQQELFDAGASRTLNSRHATGHAVDLAPYVSGQVRWDWPLYLKLAKVIKKAADDCHIPIEWGGDWKSFKDGPHFQLPRKFYK